MLIWNLLLVLVCLQQLELPDRFDRYSFFILFYKKKKYVKLILMFDCGINKHNTALHHVAPFDGARRRLRRIGGEIVESVRQRDNWRSARRRFVWPAAFASCS